MTGGAQTPVTNANKIFYLNLLAQYRLASQVKEEVEHFLKGEILSPLSFWDEIACVHGVGMVLIGLLCFRPEWVGPWEPFGYFWWKWAWGKCFQSQTPFLTQCFSMPTELASCQIFCSEMWWESPLCGNRVHFYRCSHVLTCSSAFTKLECEHWKPANN